MSTDYIFNGENFRPYIETDITNPQGIYGATKLASEKAIQSINHKSAIISRYAYLC
ncbi:MAG: sugar nucleotide-binding protein [Francisella endosymbiont of Hyalomma asiaticum]